MLRPCLSLLRRALAPTLLALALTPAAQAKDKEPPIRIGEINSYKAIPAFLGPYKKGWQLALEQVNAEGGVLGRKLEVISRDDNGNPGDSVRAAQELLAREKVELLFGGFLSNTGLALTDFAKQQQVFFLAAEPLTDKITWQEGNRYTYRLRPSTWMHVAALAQALALRKRWAIVYNYEYGQSAVATFKAMMKSFQSDVEFVAEQAVPLGKVDAGAVVQALADAKPDAIFNVLFAADLTRFVRAKVHARPVREHAGGVGAVRRARIPGTAGRRRAHGMDRHRLPLVCHRHAREQELRRGLPQALQRDAQGRLGGGLRLAHVHRPGPEGRRRGRHRELVDAFAGLKVDTPYGQIQYRKIDHQSTMGVYVGVTAVEDGKGIMKDFAYMDGARLQPPDEQVRKMRPAQ